MLPTQEIYNFIMDTHPQVNSDYSQCVDLKAVFRTEGKYTRPNKVFYSGSERQREELQRFLESLEASGRAYCLYYSVYTFDPSDRQTITKDNAKSTQILCADLDHITKEEFAPILEDLKAKGLEPNYSIFSGHGFQLVYKLDKPSTDKGLLAEFTDAMRANGYPVDEKIRDCARVMRLPFTLNCKDTENPVYTYIYSTHEGAYSLGDLRSKLGIRHRAQTVEQRDFTHYDDSFLHLEYPAIGAEKFPEAVKACLMGLRNGCTDRQIRALVLYLRDYKGAGLETIMETAQTLARVSVGKYTGDVTRDLERKVKSLFYNYDLKFNYDDLREFGSMDGKANDHSGGIPIYNSTLKEGISNKAFYTYVRLLIEQRYRHQSAFTADEVAQVCGITTINIRPRLNELSKAGLIGKKRADRAKGEKYTYTISKFGVDKSQGYTVMGIRILSNLIDAVNKGVTNETVAKFLVYMKRIAASNGQLRVSQEGIAKALNIKRPAVSKLWAKVEELNATSVCPYVTRHKTYLDKDTYSYYYEIFY